MKPDPNFLGLYARLVACTAEPGSAQGCWTWRCKVTKRYPTLNVRVRGKHRTLKAHRAMLTLLDCEGETECFPDLYDLYSLAELEADHQCFCNPLCVAPDHLVWSTKEENAKRRWHVHPDTRP